MAKHYAYDIECYKNFFSIIFISMDKKYDSIIDDYLKFKIDKNKEEMQKCLDKLDYYEFVIFEDRNDIFDIKDFIESKVVLYGFNSFKYDDILLTYLITKIVRGFSSIEQINEMLYQASYKLITFKYLDYTDELYKYQFNKPFVSIDLKELFNLKKALKMVAITMKFPFIKDLPIHPDNLIKFEDVEPLLHYNFNDVIITRFMLKLKKDELQSRIDASKIYEVDVLSASRPKMAREILIKYIQKLKNSDDRRFTKDKTYRKYIQFKDIINPFLEFEISEFKEFFNSMKHINFIVGVSKFKEVFKFNGVEYQFGIGGLHTKDRPEIFEANNSESIIDVDAK